MDEPDDKTARLIHLITEMFARVGDHEQQNKFGNNFQDVADELAKILIEAFDSEAPERARAIQAHCNTVFAALVTKTVDEQLVGAVVH